MLRFEFEPADFNSTRPVFSIVALKSRNLNKNKVWTCLKGTFMHGRTSINANVHTEQIRCVYLRTCSTEQGRETVP